MGEVDIVGKFKRIFLVLIILISIILISIVMYLVIGLGIDTRSVFIKNMTKGNETLRINGSTSNSALVYAGYSYIIKGDSLYIKLKYSLDSTSHHGADFNVTLDKNIEDINHIYLQGNKKDGKKLFWTNYFQNIQQNNVLPVQMSTEYVNYKSTIQQIKFRITNKGDTLVTFGSNYILQKNKDRNWVDIPFKKDSAFTAEMNILKANSKYENSIILSMSDFTFSTGSYRIIKIVSTKDKKNINISCSFAIN